MIGLWSVFNDIIILRAQPRIIFLDKAVMFKSYGIILQNAIAVKLWGLLR